MKRVLTVLSVIVLTGCASTVKQWYKQDATQMQYYQDLNDCERQAGYMYPPSFYNHQIGGYSANTNCYTYNNNASCYTNQTSPISLRIDANTQARANYATRCMFGKGYDLIDTSVDLSTKDGWCKKFPSSGIC